AAVQSGVAAQTLSESLKPRLTNLFGQSKRQEEAKWARAFRGKIREIDPQRLAGHQMSSILGKKMHAAHDRVGLEHQIKPRRRCEKACVIGQAERTGIGRKRFEETCDQAVFG